MWLTSLSYSARAVLEWELGVGKSINISPQVGFMLKSVREHMLENNLSVDKVLSEMGCTSGIITAKDAKRYLSKSVGIDSLGTSTTGSTTTSDNWLN